jgi:hypothetical protein
MFMSRSREEIEFRCREALNSELILFLVKKSSSPTAAYEMILDKTGDISKARSGRWLAILRRDYIDYYERIVDSVQVKLLKHDNEKGIKNEDFICKRHKKTRKRCGN